MRKYLIVGIDPGTTTGFAVLKLLNGEVLEIDSSRDISLSDLTSKIVEIGNPILVATDVSPAPSSVNRISIMLDAELWKPDKSLSRREKRKLTKSYDTDDEHQLDALAASLKAYNYVESKLRNIKNRSPQDLENRELVKLVIKGNSLREAIDKLRTENNYDDDKSENSFEEKSKKIRGLEKKIKKLQNKIEDLKEKNKLKNEKIKDLKEEISKIKSRKFLSAIKSSEVKNREQKIDSLKKELSEKDERLKKLSKLVSVTDRIDSYKEDKNKVVLKRLSSFTKGTINDLDKNLGINDGDILYIEDASGGGGSTANKIVEKVKAVVIENSFSHPAEKVFIKTETPYIESSKLDLEYFNNFVIAEKKQLEDLIHEKQKNLVKFKKSEFKSKYGDLKSF